jgi:hypothetical protein
MSAIFIRVLERLLCRETSEGAKTIVWAALGGHEDPATLEKLRGGYTSDCKVMEVSDFVLSKDGQEAESRIWASIAVHTTLALLTKFVSGRDSSDPRKGRSTGRRGGQAVFKGLIFISVYYLV